MAPHQDEQKTAIFNHHCVLDLNLGEYLSMSYKTESSEEGKSPEGAQVLLEMGKDARPSSDHPDVHGALSQFQHSPHL